MRALPLLAALAFSALTLSLPVQAQYMDQPVGQPYGQVYGQPYPEPYPQPYPQQPYPQPYGGASGPTVTCESQDGNTRECRTPFQGAPAIAEQLSQADCVPGQTWGSRGPGSVWVTGGCRARFVDGYGTPYGGQYGGGQYGTPYGHSGYTLRCESDDGRTRECRSPVGGRMMLVRQLSQAACIEGQTWGSNSGRVWVREGCRAEFAPVGGHPYPGRYPDQGQGGYWDGGYSVTCESVDRRTNNCYWDPRQGRPRLIEQLSDTACREGQSWGYNGGQLWVDRGCRGRFGNR